jgi:predicted acetyltransferase
MAGEDRQGEGARTGVTALLLPAPPQLPAYVDALQRGWSPDNVRPAEAAAEHLAAIAADPAGFLAALDDVAADGPPIALPDGSTVERLPSTTRWIWDDGFVGAMGFRWQRGSTALPPHVLGHIGFAVVPWRRGQCHATRALALMLPLARALGMDHVTLTTNPDNVASQKAIAANGGALVVMFAKDPAYGGGTALRYRIDL